MTNDVNMTEISNVTIRDVVFRNIETTIREHTKNVVIQLAGFYGFDADDALSRLSWDIKLLEKMPSKKKASSEGNEKKAKKVKAPRVERVTPSIPLPWCGTVVDDWCMAIRSNHGLFTQCTNARDGESQLCKACEKVASKSTSGTLKFGLITERDNGFTQKVTSYTSVMKKQNITKEAAIAEAEKFGWTIPDAIFNAVPAKRGRKKSDTSSSSDASASPKKRGRPMKEKPMASGSATDDMLTSMIAQAGGLSISTKDNSGKSGDSEGSKKKRVLTDEQKAKMAAGKARKAEEKAEQKRLELASKAAMEAEEIRKNSLAVASSVIEAEVASGGDAELSEEEISCEVDDSYINETQDEPRVESDDEESRAESEDEEDDESSEEGISLQEVVVKGKTYLVDNDGIVYKNVDGGAVVIGKYDKVANKVTLKK